LAGTGSNILSSLEPFHRKDAKGAKIFFEYFFTDLCDLRAFVVKGFSLKENPAHDAGTGRTRGATLIPPVRGALLRAIFRPRPL
jgi:hypothetical protein